jgi:hypothetical protein
MRTGFQGLAGDLQRRHSLFAGHRGEGNQELIQAITGFQAVD